MTAARRPRLFLVAASVAAAAALLSACGTQQAGAAATLGDTRISERTLSSEVQAVLAAKGQPTSPTFRDSGPRPEAAGWSPSGIVYRPEDAQS